MRLSLSFSMVLLAALLAGGNVAVAENYAAPPTVARDPSLPAPAKRSPRIDSKLRRERLSSAVMMLAGIICIGIVLLVFVVLWGHRARRRARQPFPQTARGDELWFLRPRKKLDPGDGPSGPRPPRTADDSPPSDRDM